MAKDLLLNLFEEGRLTDTYGRTRHFQSTILIMTSNLGAASVSPPGFKPQSTPAYEQVAMQFFRPEFYNRIDEVLSFAALSEEAMLRIARKEVAALSQRMSLVERAITLTYTDAFLVQVTKRGFDARYGARPLKRFLESQVVTPISQFLVEQPETRNATLKLSFTESGSVEVSAELPQKTMSMTCFSLRILDSTVMVSFTS